MESATASVGFCGSAGSFWGSCWLEESLEKSSAGCTLLSSQEPGGDCLVLGAEEDGGEPQTQLHTMRGPWSCQILSPWYSWT